MPTSDDELRELFRGGRAEDRAAAPTFEHVWANAEATSRRKRAAIVAFAAAAVVALVAGWLVARPAAPQATIEPPRIAETNPVPDLPVEEPAPAESTEELAAWEPYVAPTDFLLEDQGVLAGGLPSEELDDVLDLEDLTMEL